MQIKVCKLDNVERSLLIKILTRRKRELNKANEIMIGVNYRNKHSRKLVADIVLEK